MKIARLLGKKKQWIALLTMLLCVFTLGGALAESFGVIYNTDTLNLRSDGSSSSALLGTYTRGTWLMISGSRNNFYYVTTPDGRRGYMSKNYINQASQAMADIAIVDNTGGGRFLNFRQQPNYNSQVLGIFYDGVPLYVLSQSQGWLRVQINGQIGYVSSDYVRNLPSMGSSTVATIKTPNNSAINLRGGPGAGYPVIRQFPGDRYVMVLMKGNGWWQVSIDGYVGFMSNDFLVEGLRSAKDIAAENGGGSANAYALVNNPRSTQALNLRMFATTTSQVLLQLYNGTRLQMLRQGLEWSEVMVENSGETGYVMTAYLKLVGLPSVPTLRVSHPQGQKVNLRAEPNFDAGVLSQVSSGQTVTVLIHGTEWSKVKYNGKVGYMVSYLLQ